MTTDTSDIQITLTGDEAGTKTLKVEVSQARVKAAEQSATNEYAKRAKLRGFRKGKAPLAVVRKQYRDAIREQVLRDLIGESWKAAVDQEGLKPIADPGVRDLKYEEDAPVSFELLVDVMPELKLDRIGNFTLTRTETPVTDEALDQQIEEVRLQRASWVPAEDTQPEDGHLVSFGMATLEEGENEEEKQYQLLLGSGQAIPELEQLITTLHPGETTEASIRYPDDFPDEAKRGQPRQVRVTLTDVKRRDLPELNDDLARELGDFDSVDALRRAVREDLEANAKREADADLRRQLIEQIIEANDVQAPNSLVRRALSAYAQSYQVPDDQLERFTSEFRPIAERHVIRDLIIDHVAKEENLTATEADVDDRIQELAQRRDTEPAKLYASLQKSNQLGEIERGLTEEKVFTHLLEQSKVVDG
jgi:trigger factor